MIPLVLIAAGVVAVVAGAAILRSFGPRYRVGRLLASAPRVSVAEAVAIAETGAARYVRVDGRIDAEDEFEDADHRPLVFRRTRLEARSERDWRTFEDSRESVPFEIREGLDAIGVDAEVLDEGLVVVPRESAGVAGDLADRAPADIPPETRVRATVEQVSSVEHAIVTGVPTAPAEPGARAKLTAGLGRPLILTTLEPAEAMRILAGGTARPRLAAACLGLGAVLVALGIAWAALDALLPAVLRAVVPVALAASPSAGPSQAVGGDPRSSGEGPGLVGEPLIAILAVVLIAAAAIAITTLYVRMTGGPGDGRARRR
ncbi:MAG TPA: hypothetical protein VK871_11340 [Candidatus Limnocylindrales bacterium]|nr:hypothetical protein [Candidatus Limnocylindrales bacterium]